MITKKISELGKIESIGSQLAYFLASLVNNSSNNEIWDTKNISYINLSNDVYEKVKNKMPDLQDIDNIRKSISEYKEISADLSAAANFSHKWDGSDKNRNLTLSDLFKDFTVGDTVSTVIDNHINIISNDIMLSIASLSDDVYKLSVDYINTSADVNKLCAVVNEIDFNAITSLQYTVTILNDLVRNISTDIYIADDTTTYTPGSLYKIVYKTNTTTETMQKISEFINPSDIHENETLKDFILRVVGK